MKGKQCLDEKPFGSNKSIVFQTFKRVVTLSYKDKSLASTETACELRSVTFGQEGILMK